MLRSGSSTNRVYIYEEATLQTSAEYAKLTGSLEYTVVPGTSAEDALAAVKAGIDVVISQDKSSETTLPDDNANITWTLASGYNGEPGEYAVTVYYKNIIIGTAKVTVPELTVAGIEISPMEGTVKTGASNYAKTGSKLTVTYSDGSTRTVDVTLGMISGDFNKNNVGDYTGLTVTYGGKTVTGYTLHVTPKSGNNYPEYPHEGAVRVGKTAEGIDFQSSGIARVELTATGVPVKKGADVIIMVDTSSSMNNTTSGSSKSRIEVLRESLTSLVTQLQAVGADGEAQDIRIAIADFNGYEVDDSSSRYYLDANDHLTNAAIRGGTNNGQVYTGSNGLNAEAFVTAREAASVISSINTSSGTNYDYAFDAVYQLGEAILARNAQDGEDRDLFVIFMSDGAPFQYNYFSSNSDTANWNNWLQGTVTDSMWYSSAHNYFYNGSGNRHRMAEAIKGNPDAMYTVIRKDSGENYGGQQYMTQLPGLGATMYSIGFCLEQDNRITVASMEYVLKNISSDSDKFYYKVNTADELSSAFSSIGNEIAYAATNARFVDTMGSDFDLQMAQSTYTLSDGTTDTIEPEITVRAYDIYTNADGVAESEIGKRKGTYTELETVTFSTDGTEAYSDKKSGNILVDGVICANTFWYNTTGQTVSIDTNGDGTNDYDLAPETFYWKMGTVNQTELALSYYVYLTGSKEGKREAGSYPTNESAALHYTNWLGNEAKKDTVSPVLAWKSANVSYAFYLVNENGEIIVNKSTGATGSFANKVAVTNPVVYSEVLLNSGTKVQADILASGVLPEGYSLYDPDSAYSVWINSNSIGGWTITKSKDPATTYVTEYGGDPTTETSTDNLSYDYTHTVVWFAVVYTVKAVPDAVVIDYGLPVDIHVLKNDMFYDKGTLQYVGSEKTDGAVNGDAVAAFTTTEFTGAHGTATVIANASAPEDSVIRYTPSDMQMNGVEKFSYAVNYTGSENSGYYYGTVTVIPATAVYYEDSFVTFTNAKNTSEGSTIGVWTVDGTEQEGAVQDEDRPGSSSLSAIDANNLYGYDSHYTGFTRYSLGSAHKVTVDAPAGSKSNAPEARFTFIGTGFDIISLTNSDSGTITVTVTNKSTNKVTRYSVDTYYGYTYNETDGWVVDKNAEDTIWQVPVIKAEGLDYGTYEVIIQVAYLNILDHQGDGSYSFWLDAVRIYDPAKNDTTANNAHKQDDEYAPLYVTLRDLLVEGQKALDIEEPLDGAVFIDGKDSTSNITDYANPGPNNETYLAYGQGVSFKLTADKKPESVQIGVKLAYGDAATLKLGEKDFRTVTTATDMYYRLDGLSWTLNGETGKYETGIITLSNSTEGAVISVTNLKFTSSDSEPSVKVLIDEETIEDAPMLMRALYRQEKAVTVFEPEYFSAVWKAGRAKKWSLLMVTTSEDVDSITVNGTVITEYIRIREFSFRNPATYKRVWIYKTKINTAGTYTFDVIAYSEDGIAAAPEETVVTVRK
ncbi:MAG: VWA domain-containing protein [Clostridiales bacterium]|nr:VWA domain-containing protein [Clostridiales bacterium]